MAFREDVVPECRSTAHPPHTDRRRWMKVVREAPDYVSWCCQRCTEITGVYAIQVQILPRGRARGLHALGPQEAEKRRLLGSGPRPRQLSDGDLCTNDGPSDYAETCGRCRGSGRTVGGEGCCPVCKGSGGLTRLKHLEQARQEREG